jgi:hypothetical protein
MDPVTPRLPLRALTLADGYGDAVARYVGAEIDGAGALVISSEEGAALCEAMRGDLDADHWLTLPAVWKDELLLRLLADRFTSVEELRAYLATHGIPCTGHTTGRARP